MRSPTLYHLDKNVIFTMIIISVIASIVASFRYSTKQPCDPVKILAKGDKFTRKFIQLSVVGDRLTGKQVVWNFGDKKAQNGYGATVWHMYNLPGRYTITVTLDGKCKFYQTILVAQAPPVVNTDMVPQFFVPFTAIKGRPVSFKDSTPNAVRWEWRFGETATVDATTQQPTYTFQTPGYKSVTLVVNGKMIGEHNIYVEPIDPSIDSTIMGKNLEKGPKDSIKHKRIVWPSPKDSPTTKVLTLQLNKPTKEISEEELKEMLLAVIDGKKSAVDFSACLNGDLDRTVVYNGNSMPFQKFCSELGKEFKSSEKVKNLEVTITGKDKYNTILSMAIKAKKKRTKFLGVF